MTARSERYEVDTLAAPDTTVTVCIPATDPANVTRPDTGERTSAP